MKRLVILGMAFMLAVPLRAQIIEERQQTDTLSKDSRTAVVDEGRMNKGLPDTPLKSLSGQVAESMCPPTARSAWLRAFCP